MAEAFFVKNFYADRITMFGSNRAGYVLTHCLGVRINGVTQEEFGCDPDHNLFGYGVEIDGCTERVLISNSRFRRVRHGVTSGLGSADVSLNPYRHGAPRDVIVANCQ